MVSRETHNTARHKTKGAKRGKKRGMLRLKKPADPAEIAAFVAAKGVTTLPPGAARGIDTVHMKAFKHAKRSTGKPGQRSRRGRARGR